MLNEVSKHPWGCEGMVDVVLSMGCDELYVTAVSDQLESYEAFVPEEATVMFVSEALRFIPSKLDFLTAEWIEELVSKYETPQPLSTYIAVATIEEEYGNLLVYSNVDWFDPEKEYEIVEAFPEAYVVQGEAAFSARDLAMTGYAECLSR